MADFTPLDAQLDAYNARDVDRFLACYSPDVVVRDGAGATLMEGHDAMRAEYAPCFVGFPNLEAEILQWIEAGDYVLDEERILGWQAEPVHAAIYHVADGLIDHVRLIGG